MTIERLRTSLRSGLRDGEHVLDEVDTDKLTPAALALFRAIQAPLAPLDVRMQSRKTRREMGWVSSAFISEEDLDKPVVMFWRGWSHYPAGSTMDIHEYLNREAMKIDPGYAPSAGSPYPARMTIGQVLAYLNAHGRKITAATWRAYVARGQAPKAAEYVSRTPLWDAATIEEWRRRGAGTELDEGERAES